MGIVRQIKNVTGGYSSSQKLVRDITANDDSIPNRSDMREVAELTHEEHELFMIMDVLDKRLNDKGKYWRHINKALMLLDYLVRHGSDGVIRWCQENLYVVKTLREYHHRDESGREHGSDIRKRAKDLTSLIMDKAKLSDVRSGRGRRRRSREESSKPRTPRRPTGGEDDEMARALELSKQTAAAEDEKRRMAGGTDNSMQSAYELQMQNQAEANMLFQQQQQQAAAEEAALAQAQADYLAQQQMAQAEAQRLYEMQMAQQQQEAYLQQQMAQQQQLQLQMQQQQQEELLRQQQQDQERQNIQPLKTGSNNPFAAFNAQQQKAQETPAVPLETTPTGSKPRLHRQSTFDREHMDRLDQILSLDAPMDTFGNTGMAKMPSQHTQNTGFVNSSGHGLTQTLTARRTGLSSNPFIPQQPGATGQSPNKNNPQYTGIAATQMQPAHTGYGFGNANHSSSNLIDL